MDQGKVDPHAAPLMQGQPPAFQADGVVPQQQYTQQQQMPQQQYMQQQMPQQTGPVMLPMFAFAQIEVKQVWHGCCNEVFCCPASEFEIYPYQDPKNIIGFIQEHSSCCCRVCFPAIRPARLTLHAGANAEAPIVGEMDRPCRCPAPSLCCNQEMSGSVQNMDGGRVEIPCYCCKPAVSMYRPGETAPTDVVEWTCACKALTLPFVSKNFPPAYVQKDWNGILKECCLCINHYTVQFPQQADVVHRFQYIMSTVLLDMAIFTRRNQNNNES